MVLATVRGSGRGEDSGVSMWMAESAPRAMAVRNVSTALGGPIVKAVMLSIRWGEFAFWARSRRRTASSTAKYRMDDGVRLFASR